jgi:uncharacterized tellurite resistance protein B-like protein
VAKPEEAFCFNVLPSAPTQHTEEQEVLQFLCQSNYRISPASEHFKKMTRHNNIAHVAKPEEAFCFNVLPSAPAQHTEEQEVLQFLCQSNYRISPASEHFKKMTRHNNIAHVAKPEEAFCFNCCRPHLHSTEGEQQCWKA